MKLTALLPALAMGVTALGRNEMFKWGTWEVKLKGSSYTHSWATTKFEGGFHSDTFVVKEIRAGTKGEGQGQLTAQWCKDMYKLPGVEALYTEDGQFIRTLSCDNQNAKILSATFKATPKPGYGRWKLTMKGSGYTHSWANTEWYGNTEGFMIKEITPGSAGAAGKEAQKCEDRYGLPGAEALYSAEGKFIRVLSCDNQNAHVLHANWERLAYNENVLLNTAAADTYVSGNCYVGHGSGVKHSNTGLLTDGVTNSRKGYWHSCKAGASAWAKFKLAHTSSVSHISVANRADCCEGRLTGVQAILVDKNGGEHICGAFGVTGKGKIATVQCSARIQAKYVKIVGGGAHLHVAEVMAFGTRSVKNGVLNVLMDSANKLETSVSGNCYVGHGSGVKNANSGVLTDGETFSRKGYWHSCKRGEFAWAKFEIKQPSSVWKVDVANRADCCENRLTGAKVYVQDADTGAEVLCGIMGATGRGKTGSVFCNEKIKGNAVILKGGPNGGLNVAEVSAWGGNYKDNWYVDCEGSWGEFGACAKTCGESSKQRTFSVSTAGQHGGKACVANDGEVQSARCYTECREDVDVEMTIDETEESFTDTKKQSLINKIAKELGLKPEDIEINVGAKPNPVGRRLIEQGSLLITVTIKVLPSQVTTEIAKLEAPRFTKVTGAKFLQFKPTHGSSMCATCKWDGKKIIVTHYVNAQKHGEATLAHKCWHDGAKCNCACNKK